MFKTIKAIWNVIRNKDINADQDSQDPIKVKKRSPEELSVYRELMKKEKELFTENGEPWFKVIDMDIDYENMSNGAFELDWNDLFISKLLRIGYVGKTDSDLVDRYFTDVCRNVVLETYEQAAADLHPNKSSDLGNGRREYR